MLTYIQEIHTKSIWYETQNVHIASRHYLSAGRLSMLALPSLIHSSLTNFSRSL